MPRSGRVKMGEAALPVTRKRQEGIAGWILVADDSRGHEEQGTHWGKDNLSQKQGPKELRIITLLFKRP